ncbi:zinc finger protein 804A [Pristis pectinata]|uniref:zinc finger protein 804A n=1 Tax=Pristis pectinata TaxID=685728 RepID=UPI00223D856C|nr:zinc finger protein 804A [Pristis pectinata]
MACYYIVISSTHLSNGHFRNIKGVFRGPLCKNGSKTLDYTEKEKAITKALEDLKANFYCELCDKQYYKHQEFDNHINSYDHAHKQRLKELKQREFARNVASKSRKDEKKQEKALKRLHELAELRKQVGCAPGSGPMFKSTTVAVKNPPGKNHQCAGLDTEGADSKLSDPECGMAGSTTETSRGKNKLSASSAAEMWKAEHCNLGKQIRGQKIGFSFSFPKKVPVKLESSAAVFCENSEEGASKKNTIHKHKINNKTFNTQTGSGPETVVDLESSKHQQQNNSCSTAETSFKEVPQDLVITDFDNGVAETNDSSCAPQVQWKNKPKLPLFVSVSSTDQDTPQIEEKTTENAESKDFILNEDKNEDMTVSSQETNSLMEGETSTPSEELSQAVNGIEESLHSLREDCCSENVVTETAGMQNNPCLCRRPGAPFFPVLSKDDSTVLQWPSEMLHFTNTQPSITFCCNPLYFDFRSSKSKGCAEEIKSKVDDLDAPQSSLKEKGKSNVSAKGDFLNRSSDMKLDSPSLYTQGVICSDERYHAVQDSDLDVCNEQVVGLKHHYDGTEREASIREIISYCKPKKLKKHRRSSRHLRHKRRKQRIAEERFKNCKGESKPIHLCKKLKRRKVTVEWKSRNTSEVGEGSSSSGTMELSDEERVTDSAECRPGQGKMRTEDSEGSSDHLEVKFDQNNETSEKLGGFWKNIDSDSPKRNSLKNKYDDRVCNTNNEAEGKSSENNGELDNFLTVNETIRCRQQKLARNSEGDSSPNASLYKRKQGKSGNGYNSFSDVEYSDQPTDERHSCQNHSKKRGYASLDGEAVIIYHKRCRHRYFSSPHKDNKQIVNSPHRSWSQVSSSSADFNHKSRKESHQQKQQCQARHSLNSKTLEREGCLSPGGLHPCSTSFQENTCEVSLPGKDKNMINASPITTGEDYSSVAKPPTGSFVEDYHSKTNNHLLDRPVSKMTTCDGHKLDEHMKNSFSEMWVNHKDPSGDILFPRLSFVLDDGTVLPHSEQAHNQGLLQKDVIPQKQTDSCGDNIKDIKASLNEVFLCHCETAPEVHTGRTWLQDNSDIPHYSPQQSLQNDATVFIGKQPQKSEQMSKPFSPLSQTISFAPEEIEKYRQLQIQAQQHIEQQKLDSRVKTPSPATAAPMQQPASRQQSVTTASITTIHRTVLQHHPATAAAMAAGSFIQPHLQSIPHAHPLPPHVAHISLAPALYPGGPPAFLAAPQLHIIPACALHPDHFALHPLPAATLFPPLLTLHTPAIPLHHFLNSSFTTQDFLHLTGAPT